MPGEIIADGDLGDEIGQQTFPVLAKVLGAHRDPTVSVTAIGRCAVMTFSTCTAPIAGNGSNWSAPTSPSGRSARTVVEGTCRSA